MVGSSLQEALGESLIVSPSVATLAAADRMRARNPAHPPGVAKADARRDLVDRVRRALTGASKKAAGDFARLALAISRLSRRGRGLREQPKPTNKK
jgi:hypothetical protein